MTDTSEATGPSKPIRLHTHIEAHLTIVTVSGEVDTVTAPDLADAVTAAASIPMPLLVIDLTEVTFLTSAGLQVLVHANTIATGTVRVVADGPATSRPIRIVGLDDVINLYPTVAAARTDPLPPRPL